MPWTDFLAILLATGALTLLARILPVALFAEKRMPSGMTTLLAYIPVAAFAALVTNDLFDPELLTQGLLPSLLPWLALVPVAFVARRTRSLGLSIVVGVAAFWALRLVFRL